MVRLWCLLIALLWGCISCSSSPPPQTQIPAPPSPLPSSPPTEKEKPSPKPRNIFKDLEYVYFRKDRPEWMVRAEKAEQYADRIEMHFPKVISLKDKGLSVQAQKGIYWKDQDLFVFQKGVILRTPHKGILSTEKLYYFPREKRLMSEAPLVLKDRGLIIKGVGFEYYIPKGKMRIRKKTQVEFHG